MAIPLALLGFFRDGTTEYGAARARTDGSWHIIRKQYGENSSTYSYARFASASDYAAAKANPDAIGWQAEPFSSIDYTLLLAGLVSPLPASTASMGALAASGAVTDVSPVVGAIDQGNTLLAQMIAGQATGGPRATETTLAKVAGALAGSLKVMPDGTALPVSLPAGQQVGISNTVSVTAKFWPDTQPVSGPLTDTQLRAAALPTSLATIPLAANAATAALQMAGNSTLADVSAKLGAALTFTLPAGAATSQGQADQLAKLEALRALLASTLTVALPGGSTAARQDAGNTLLQAIAANTATSPTLNLAPKASGGTVAASLLSAAGNNATVLKASGGQVYGINAHNISTNWRYLQLFNSGTSPAAGTSPMLIVAIAPGGVRDIAFGFGVPFATGISFTITAKAGVLDLLSTVLAGEVGVNIAYA